MVEEVLEEHCFAGIAGNVELLGRGNMKHQSKKLKVARPFVRHQIAIEGSS